jgi:hypothetical protein
MRLIFAALSSTFLFSCAGKVLVHTNTSLDKNPTKFYVVEKGYSYSVPYGTQFHAGDGAREIGSKEKEIGETTKHISEYLKDEGFNVASGQAQNVPTEFDIIVNCWDYWQWDMAKYLKYLYITLNEPSSGNLIASGEYVANQGEFHDYPSAAREVPNVLRSILGKLNVPNKADSVQSK